MSRRPAHAIGQRLAFALAIACACLYSVPARATVPKVISGDETLGGDSSFYSLTIKSGGTLHVPPYMAGSPTTTGRVVLRANTIIVESGGTIEADGAGYAGVDGAQGLASLANAGGNLGPDAGFPGGGGGFVLSGGSGALQNDAGVCTPLSSPNGGAAWNPVTATALPDALPMGSAGGAANTTPVTVTHGGSGGGVIVLIAAVITLDGTVSANGAPAPFPVNGVAAGGGSGGIIEIEAVQLGGTGTLSVVGGNGGTGTGIPGQTEPNNGGAGSPGLVLFNLPQGVAPVASLSIQATAGTTGDCGFSASTAPPQILALPGACIDADGDGYDSDQCGGNDCDDSDRTIHPGAPEVCNGKDNDCNGQIDQGPSLCPPGSTCTGAACVPLDAGLRPTDGGALPDYADFIGGCDVPLGPVGRAGFWLGLTSLAFGFARAFARARVSRGGKKDRAPTHRGRHRSSEWFG
jgi:hypothetical protein